MKHWSVDKIDFTNVECFIQQQQNRHLFQAPWSIVQDRPYVMSEKDLADLRRLKFYEVSLLFAVI